MCIDRVVIAEVGVTQVPARVDLSQVVGGAQVRLVVPQADALQLGDFVLERARPAGMHEKHVSTVVIAIEVKALEQAVLFVCVVCKRGVISTEQVAVHKLRGR